MGKDHRLFLQKDYYGFLKPVGTGVSAALNAIREIFLSWRFSKRKADQGGRSRAVQATLYCSVLMVAYTCPRLREVLPKTRNCDQKSLLKITMNLTSFLAFALPFFGICKCSFPILGAVGRTPQTPSFYKSPHFSCRSSVIVATKPRKAQKRQLPVKT